jgi:hypothetical protein
MSKSCGQCKYFARWPGDGGLCEKQDCRTYPDNKGECKDFKGIKYNRNKNKIEEDNEIKSNII